jgi:DNA recombination protein RmuC
MAGEYDVTRDGAFHAQRYAQGDDAQQHVVAAPARDRPLLSGDARDLWIGSGLVVLAFLAIVAFLMVWRVGGARARRKKRNAELFQPAGEGAEITFDDDPAASQPSAKELRERRKREKAERAAAVKAAKSAKAGKVAPPAEEPAEESARAADEAEVVIERSKPAEEPPTPQPRKAERRSQPFAALFSRRKKPDPYVSGTLDLGADNTASDQMRLHPLAGERRRPRDDERSEPEAPEAAAPPDQRRPVRAEAEQAHRLAERLEEERRQERTRLEAAEEMRRKAIDEARLVAERQQNEIEISRRAEAARLQAEAEAREEARRRNYEREAEFERRKQLAAVEQREREMRRADSAGETLRRELSQELERKIEALAARLPDRALQAQQFAEPLPADPALLRAVDRIARDLAQQRTALDEAVGALSARIEEVGASARDTDGLRQDLAGLKRALSERFSGPSAPIMQLEDILRNALPPDAYDLRAMLSNNRKADCLVRLPNPPGPIVIDGRFPVEAFQKLHADEAADQGAAENEFRRTALRHIVDIAERLIIPGETGDSALMFLPSESMHTELLARFQDLVQDSYRARVWIVSPTTLMATLHTMRAVMREAPKPPPPEVNDAQQVLAEVEALRRRVQGLESSVDRVRHDMRDLVGAQDQSAPQSAATAPAFLVEPASAPTAAPASAPASVAAPSNPPSPPPFLASAPVQAAPVHGHANGAAPPPMQSQPSGPAAPAAQPAPPERPAPAFLLPPVPPVR